MNWFKRRIANRHNGRRALQEARQKARALGVETAELLGPQVFDPRADPEAVKDFLLAVVGAANLSRNFPDLSPHSLERVHGDFALAFWDSITQQLEGLS